MVVVPQGTEAIITPIKGKYTYIKRSGDIFYKESIRITELDNENINKLTVWDGWGTWPVDINVRVKILEDTGIPQIGNINVQGTASQYGYYNSDVAVSTTVSDTHGIQKVKYWIGTTNPATTTPENMEWTTPYTYTSGSKEKEMNIAIPVDAEIYNAQNVYVLLQVQDFSGNTCKATKVLQINSTKPKVAVSFGAVEEGRQYFNRAEGEPQSIGKVTIIDRKDTFNEAKAKSEIMESISLKDGQGNVIDDTKKATMVDISLESESEYTDTHVANVIFKGEGHYQWNVNKINYINKADMSNDVLQGEPLVFCIDESKPEIKLKNKNNEKDVNSAILGNEVRFGILTNKEVVIEADAKDAVSGLAESGITYYKEELNKDAMTGKKFLTEKELQGREFKTLEEAPGINKITNPEMVVIYVRAEDKAGNVSYVATDGIIVEKYKCEIKIEAPQTSVYTEAEDGTMIPLYNNKPQFGAYVNEVTDYPYSGIKEVYYTITIGETTSEKHMLYESSLPKGNEKTYRYEDLEKGGLGFDIDVNGESEKYILTVTAIDHAGNVANDDYVFGVSSTHPTLSIDFDKNNPSGYYNEARTATVTIHNNNWVFNEESANAVLNAISYEGAANVANTSQPSYRVGSWTQDSSNPNVYRADVTFFGEGTYTWKIDEVAEDYLPEGEELVVYTDKAGNKNVQVRYDSDTKNPFRFVIDKTAPQGTVKVGTSENATLESGKVSFEQYSNKELAVTISVQDNITSQAALKVEYYKDNGTTYLSKEELKKKQFKTYNGSVGIKPNERSVVYFKITDQTGNVIYLNSVGVIVEENPSNIKLNASEGTDKVYNTDVPVTVNISEVTAEGTPYSGIKKVSYQVKADGKVTQSGTLCDYKTTAHAYENLKSELNKKITVDAKKNNSNHVVVEVIAEDYAGNKDTARLKLKIDTTKPDVQVTYNNNNANKVKKQRGYFAQSRTATVKITERTENFVAEEATKGITITAVDAAGKEIQLNTAEMISDWKTTEGKTADEAVHTATIKYRKDGNYTFSIKYTDIAGNTNTAVDYGNSVTPKKFTVDKGLPTGTLQAQEKAGWQQSWEKLLEKVTFGLYSSKPITITATAEDAISGIAKMEYYKTADKAAKTIEELSQITEWKKYKKLSVDSDEQFVVYLKITDTAGNVNYISTSGMIVDTQAPKEELSAPTINIETVQADYGVYNGDVEVSVSVADLKKGDTYSGIKEITYEVQNMGSVTQSGSLYEAKKNARKQNWNGNITVESSKNNSNDVTVVVTAKDNAGNESSNMIKLKIDTTAPRVDISYDNNNSDSGSYYNSGRVATITVTERNFAKEEMTFVITNTDGIVPQVSEFQKIEGSGNGDDTRYVATVAYTADGDYTFGMSGQDMAGNTCAQINYAQGTTNATEFTIDGTLPVVSVSYDNNAAQNGNFFKEGRTATIMVQEHNFDLARVTLTQTATLEGSPIAVPVASWSSNGDVHTATINYEADGDYTFGVTMKDMAGNESGAANYGNAVAAEAFTIDKTIEKPQIGGVENGKSYAEDVILQINYADINYAGSEVTLLRTTKDAIDVNVTEEFIKNLNNHAKGGSGINDTFAKTPENDGIYTLTIKQTDKAGNEESESIIFTINRYGSVYAYSEYLANLQGSYVQSVQKDVVITEYNPNPLVANSQKVEISKDGAPLPDVEYTVAASQNTQVEAGESGWYQYEYTLAAENFEDDGVYRVRIASEDTAGNQPETANFEENDIIFRVDTTPAEITSITGLDSVAVKANEVDVDYEIFDAIGLKKVSVYVDDKEVESCDSFENMINYSGNIVLNEGSNQNVRFVVEDLAGNITDTNEESFQPSYAFNDNITVSTNAWILWYANKPLFVATLAGGVAVIGLVTGLGIRFRRRKRI